MNNSSRLPISLIAAAGFALALLLLFDVIPFLRGGFGWQWPYALPPLVKIIPLLVVALVYLGGAWLLLRRASRDRLIVLWSLFGVVALTLAVMALREDDLLYALFTRTASGVTTGNHFAAAEIDWRGDGLYDWGAVMVDFIGRSGHVSVSPPGMPMWYGFLNDVLSRFPTPMLESLQRPLVPFQCHNYRMLAYPPPVWSSSWFGILMPLWAALAVIPLYGAARRLTGTWAKYAVVWYPLIPALVAFAPSWSTLFPLFSLLIFWWFDLGFTRRRWLVAAGVLAGVSIFITFAFVPYLGLLGFYTLARYFLVERKQSPAPSLLRPVSIGLWFGVGIVAPWLVYTVFSRLTFFDVFGASMYEHLILPREYLPWVWLHFWDWVLWSGLPLMLLWWGGLWVWARTRRDDPPLLGIALALTIFILDVSGVARGESGRVWLPFTPFVLIAAVDGLRRFAQREATSGDNAPAYSLVTLAQAAVMLASTITLAVINTPDLTPPPQSPGSIQAATANGTTFSSRFALAAWDATSDGETVTLRLDWQQQTLMTTPYWFSALLVAPDGTPAPEAHVWQPLETRYPTTCWQSGEIVGETVTLPLPGNAAPGDWWVSLASFSDETASQRLPVTLPDGTTDDQIGLGPIPVP